MYISDPNAAWGDGLSTRSATDAVERSGAPKAAPKAEKSVPTVVADEPGNLGSTAAVPTAGSAHVVRSGETFSSIAQAVYGSAAYYPHLIRANPHANPNNLKLGTTITIPKLDDVKAAGGTGERSTAGALKMEEKIDPTKQYRVVAGDSLYKISQKRFGTPAYVEAIYEKNKQLIGPNATKLNGEVMTSSPSSTPAARTDRCSPAVPLEHADTCSTPTNPASAFSKSRRTGPSDSRPERITSSTSASSSGPSDGRESGMRSVTRKWIARGRAQHFESPVVFDDPARFRRRSADEIQRRRRP